MLRNSLDQTRRRPRLAPILALSALLTSAFAVAQDMDPHLTNEQRQELIELLESSRTQLEELASLSTGDAWNAAPGEGRWSVGETVEHLMLAEEGIFGMAMGALESEVDPEWEALAEMQVSQLVDRLKDRSQKFDAPEPFQPKSEMTRSELLGKFAMLRARTLDFVRTTDAPVRQHTATGPPGKMNAHQWLALIAAHNLRHNLQIVEAQAEAAAPAVQAAEATS